MKLIVKLAGKYPLKFHTNLCGHHYSAVTEAEATQFKTQQEATIMARSHGVGNYEITPTSDPKQPKQGKLI